MSDTEPHVPTFDKATGQWDTLTLEKVERREWTLWPVGAEGQTVLIKQPPPTFVKEFMESTVEVQPMTVTAPVPRILFCPHCEVQHVDRGEWVTRPHHTHLCAFCGKTWRIEPYAYGVSFEPDTVSKKTPAG